MRRLLLLTLFSATTIALLLLNRDRLVLIGIESVAHRTITAPLAQSLPDGLHVLLCGAGNPLPDPKRSGPCAAVMAGETIIIVDAGSSAARNLAMFGIRADQVDAILITHFHSDHMDGLGELLLQRWAVGAQTAPTPVHGPQGIEEIVAGFNLAYLQDTALRIAHHGAQAMRPEASGGQAVPFATPAAGEMTLVLEQDGLTVRSFQVDHGPVKPAVGYRFDYKGRSLVISGDTKRSSNLEALNQDIDLLVHEAQNAEMVMAINRAAQTAGQARLEQIAHDVLDYHTTPVEAAQSAAAINASHLLYTHVAPAMPFSFMHDTFTRGVDQVYEGPVTVGEDGTLVLLPADEDEIEVRKADRLI